jgi:hypothetical protein
MQELTPDKNIAGTPCVSITTLAEYIGVSRAVLTNLAKAGKIKRPIRIGTRLYWTVEEAGEMARSITENRGFITDDNAVPEEIAQVAAPIVYAE